MSHGHRICLSLVLVCIVGLLGAPVMSEASSASEDREALQHRDPEKAKTRPRPSLVFSLVVEAPQSDVIRCVTDVLKQGGWRVLPFKKDKKQLLAFRDVEVNELERIADTKRGDRTIQWNRGRVNLILTFSASHNATSVDIKARILAEGETSTPLLRPTNWWPLPSTGALEDDVLAALQKRCGSTT